MFRKPIVVLGILGLAALSAAWPATEQPDRSQTREFSVGSGGTLILDLRAGGTVEIEGTGGSSVHVDYVVECAAGCDVDFEEHGGDLKVTTSYLQRGGQQRSSIDLRVRVPAHFDIELDSVGGGLSIDGVDGRFTGKTMGGGLRLHDVRGEAELTTMGGRIVLTDSELDGKLETMGGEVLFDNVIGDVKGASMGGDVRYKNVQRRHGGFGAPPRTGDLDDVSADTVQVSTMGGSIEIEIAPEGADLHTMGGDIDVRDANRFVRAKTMGGDITIEAVDGWVDAVTMGGDIHVTVTGTGGQIVLASNAGNVVLEVPSGFGMDLDLEVAFTRNSRQEYRIEAPGGSAPETSPEWDYDHGTPRKYLRSRGTANGGGQSVRIRTINGNVVVREY